MILRTPSSKYHELYFTTWNREVQHIFVTSLRDIVDSIIEISRTLFYYMLYFTTCKSPSWGKANIQTYTSQSWRVICTSRTRHLAYAIEMTYIQGSWIHKFVRSWWWRWSGVSNFFVTIVTSRIRITIVMHTLQIHQTYTSHTQA